MKFIKILTYYDLFLIVKKIMMNLSIERVDETREDLCTLLWAFLLLVMVISTLQIYFLHICINGLVQLRNANRIGTENMPRVLPGAPCGKYFYFLPKIFFKI